VKHQNKVLPNQVCTFSGSDLNLLQGVNN